MSSFSRFMRFRSDAEPTREPRVSQRTQITDKMKPTVDERTAEDAAMILETGAVERVFTRLRNLQMQRIVKSMPGTPGITEREAAHMAVYVIDSIEADIRAMADDLKLHRANNSGATTPLTRNKEAR